jgi:hypothetical protein
MIISAIKMSTRWIGIALRRINYSVYYDSDIIIDGVCPRIVIGHFLNCGPEDIKCINECFEQVFCRTVIHRYNYAVGKPVANNAQCAELYLTCSVVELQEIFFQLIASKRLTTYVKRSLRNQGLITCVVGAANIKNGVNYLGKFYPVFQIA